jgi:hypothetical protein
MTQPRDRNDMSDSTLMAEPTETIDANEPIEPKDRTEPTDPIEKTEPFDAIESTESSDQSDRRELFDDISISLPEGRRMTGVSVLTS